VIVKPGLPQPIEQPLMFWRGHNETELATASLDPLDYLRRGQLNPLTAHRGERLFQLVALALFTLDVSVIDFYHLFPLQCGPNSIVHPLRYLFPHDPGV